MKKIHLYLFSLFVISFLASQTVLASNKDSLELKTIGIGFQVNPGSYTNNSYLVTINLSNHFRLEPSYTYSKDIDDSEFSSFDSESFTAGIGIYGMFQYKKVNVYGGLKVSYGESLYSYEYNYPQYFDNDNGIYKLLRATPTIGIEYYINNHLSFGGEIGYGFTSSKDESGNESNYQYTNTALTVHFYF